MLVRLEHWINRFSDVIGKLAGILFLLLLLNVFYDVVARYLFNSVSIGMQEMEWHLYASMFLLGIPYAISTDGHVRVDLIYERLSSRRKAMLDIFGALFLLLPFVLMVGWFGSDFAWQAYTINESSGDPGGLPYRWIIKGMIAFAFFAMAISGIGLLLHSINTICGYHADGSSRSTGKF